MSLATRPKLKMVCIYHYSTYGIICQYLIDARDRWCYSIDYFRVKRTYKREVKHVSVTVFEEYPVAMANQQVGWVSVIPAPDSNHVQIRLASAYVGTGGAQHLRVEYDNYDTPNDESWDGWHTSSSCSATYAVGAALDRFNPLISVNYDMSGLYIRYLHNSHSRRTR